MICVAFASIAFSMSSLRVDGTSRMSWPLEILWTVVESSFVIITNSSKSKAKVQSRRQVLSSKVGVVSINVLWTEI